MNYKYTSEQEVQKIRKWFRGVDLKNAFIPEVERQIYEALFGSVKQAPWSPAKIAPLAQPGNISELVSPNINGVNQEIFRVSVRTDSLYDWLSDFNNALKAEIETVERSVSVASDSIRDVAFINGDDISDFDWISDSFNTSAFVDKSASTVFVDTNYGMVGLLPEEYEKVGGFEVVLDNEANKNTFPGCNLLILDVPNVGNTNDEPKVTLETTNSRDLENMLDDDPLTWFEVERNFIPPEQKMVRKGRAFVTDSSGTLQNVLGVTADYDWRVFVQWPGSQSADQGADGKGRYLAEFVTVDSVNEVDTKPDPNVNRDYQARLVFDCILATPVELSAVRVAPFTRTGAPNISVNKILVTVEGLQEPILIVQDQQLTTTGASNTKIEKYIDRNTGSQSKGALYGIPTNRKVSKIRFEFSAKPYKVRLAHPFGEVQQERRSERKYLFVSSVDREVFWQRVPVFQSPPQLISRAVKTGVTGSLLNTSSTNLPNVGNVSTDGSHDGPLSFLSDSVTSAAGSVGLTTSNPFAAILLNVGTNLLGSLMNVGSFSRTFTVLDQKVGYDVFDGYRASIAIRDLSLEKVKYKSSGVLRSVKRSFPRRVSKIGLFVEEVVPEEWGTGNWIKYFISIDGVNWSPIEKLSGNNATGMYTPPSPVRDVYFQAVFTGNSSDPNRTAWLRNVALRGLPAGI